MAKILFIGEGAKTEKQFYDLLIKRYFKDNDKDKEYVSYNTNIYTLYDKLANDDALEIVELIKEEALEKRDIKTYNLLNEGGFSYIYLFFDFDCHAPNFNIKKIREMLKLFDNETEHGKMYINYPMMESIKHLKKIPDNNYNSYVFTKEECKRYKTFINNFSSYKEIRNYTPKIFKEIIKQNLYKYAFISGKRMDNYKLYKNNFSQLDTLKYQLKYNKNSNKYYVFNTSVFWGIDYFGASIYDKYID